MNLRTLKKLSKRAAPLLPLLGEHRKQFPAVRGDNYIGIVIRARKHWERGRSVHADLMREEQVKKPAADGNGWIYMHPPDQPRKGTIMVGALCGYYEPEWVEHSAWEALLDYVYHHFCNWDGENPVPTRRFRRPADILAAAREMIREAAEAPAP